MTSRIDRSEFLRPIAHRGLHDGARGIIENSQPAFDAAVAKGYGIECDVRPIRGGVPVVFHDETLERLTGMTGALADLNLEKLAAIRYPACGTAILTLAGLCDLVAGRVPLLIEIKSEWQPIDRTFLDAIAAVASAYRGAIALMSFDPGVMTYMRAVAPDVPRGIVSGLYESGDGDTWWSGTISPERAYRLAHLLESAPVNPDFIAYHVKALPTPVTRYVREVLGLPLFTWTVRDAADLATARVYADAPIFEGIDPAMSP